MSTLNIINDKQSKESPFGVLEFLHWNHPWNNYKYPSLDSLDRAVSLMREAGIAWVRMDFLWDEIEESRGQFKFDKYDYIVDILRKNNLHVLGILNYCALWASPAGKWNSPPQDHRTFVNYTKEVINRYKDRIKYWEVWNEPDSNIYWADQDGLKSYCLLLKETYLSAKEIDPDCKILNGGLANGLPSVHKLYANGAKDYFDILNIHFFESPLHKGAIKAVIDCPKEAYRIMCDNGDSHKKIWLTEIGCPGLKEGLETNNWWLEENPSESVQAEWLEKVFSSLLKDKNIEKIFWAFFRDCKGHWNDGVDYFGLVRWDFSPKPAFFSYQKCVKD